jgi:hypothetical protein
MFDHTAPLLVPSHMADRMTEAQARRLAKEARAGSTRTLWLTGELRSAVHSTAALVTRLRHVPVRPGPRLATGHHRA